MGTDRVTYQEYSIYLKSEDDFANRMIDLEEDS